MMLDWFRRGQRARRTGGRALVRRPALRGERLESRALMAQLTPLEVEALLDRASAATRSEDGIIAVVDRTGQILGVRVEAGVVTSDLGFAIDGAVAKARTGAFFSNGQAILTSRTVSHISQSTNTQREVEANPASADPRVNGPGFVAPVGVGGQFPPGILRQPLVDLFAIEHTNRVGVMSGPGGTLVVNRSSYAAQVAGSVGAVGSQAGQGPQPLARGIATMPGGLGIYRAGTNKLIGGIGVFFPGPDGFATFEQGFVANPAQTREQRLNGPKALEAETIVLKTLLPVVVKNGPPPVVGVTLAPQVALSRAGGIGGVPPLTLAQAQNLVNRVNAAARINLGGIALQTFGPQAGPAGVQTLFTLMRRLGPGSVSGSLEPVAPGGVMLQAGVPQPAGWLVPPTASSFPGGLSAAQVEQIVNQGITRATQTRAQIRLQPTFAKMVLAVADLDGRLLGVFRMPDATAFSIDVAIAKSRNTAYYASNQLQPQDQAAGVPLGTAFTNRTFRYLAVPKYPSGNASAPPGPFSILNAPGVAPRSGLNVGAPRPVSAFLDTVLGYDSFTPGSNFRAGTDPLNQNGVVFFPGSTALYRGRTLAGGYGISGDGVDQDDVVTFFGAGGFLPPEAVRANQQFVRGIRLPWIKFSRNAAAGV